MSCCCHASHNISFLHAQIKGFSACSFGWWLVLVCSERKVLLAGGWFVLREKYCWLVADKSDEHDVYCSSR
jgi:hypothetical protein